MKLLWIFPQHSKSHESHTLPIPPLWNKNEKRSTSLFFTSHTKVKSWINVTKKRDVKEENQWSQSTRRKIVRNRDSQIWLLFLFTLEWQAKGSMRARFLFYDDFLSWSFLGHNFHKRKNVFGKSECEGFGKCGCVSLSLSSKSNKTFSNKITMMTSAHQENQYFLNLETLFFSVFFSSPASKLSLSSFSSFSRPWRFVKADVLVLPFFSFLFFVLASFPFSWKSFL